MPCHRLIAGAFVSLACLAAGTEAQAGEPLTIELLLKDHRFVPAEIRIPAGRRADLHIRNDDVAAEEFDSPALKVEKIVPAGASVTVHLRPLGPGRFAFMGEFHPDTARGVVVAE